MSNDILKQLMNNENHFDFETFQQQAIADLKAGKPLLGEDGIITPLVKKIMEASLEGEIEAHLEETKPQSNRRNGKSSKTVQSGSGAFELQTPRDRNGSFEPHLVKKRQTVLNATLDKKILGLYGLGMSYEDIRQHLQELYGVEVSAGTINAVTDQLIPVIADWRNRPLEAIYPILFLDAMHFKIRDDGKVSHKVIYNLLGINQQGRKEILGFYVADNEGANFWLSVLNDLKARGIEDILIACVDGLTGFPEAIQTAFPKTEVQLCIVHQIRHSIKYVSSNDQKAFMKDLKTVYRADTKDLAEAKLIEMDDKWGKKYPLVIKSWQTKWDSLSTYFKFSKDIRRLIYTTNPIEGFHRQIRKYTKSKGAFTSEQALFKLFYCACQRIKEKWTMPIRDWAATISQLDIFFPDRIKIELN